MYGKRRLHVSLLYLVYDLPNTKSWNKNTTRIFPWQTVVKNAVLNGQITVTIWFQWISSQRKGCHHLWVGCQLANSVAYSPLHCQILNFTKQSHHVPCYCTQYQHTEHKFTSTLGYRIMLYTALQQKIQSHSQVDVLFLHVYHVWCHKNSENSIIFTTFLCHSTVWCAWNLHKEVMMKYC